MLRRHKVVDINIAELRDKALALKRQEGKLGPRGGLYMPMSPDVVLGLLQELEVASGNLDAWRSLWANAQVEKAALLDKLERYEALLERHEFCKFNGATCYHCGAQADWVNPRNSEPHKDDCDWAAALNPTEANDEG